MNKTQEYFWKINCIVFQIPRKLLYFCNWKQRWVWKQTKEGFSEAMVSVFILPPYGGKENCKHNTKLNLQFFGLIIACLLVVSFGWWSVQWICSGWTAVRRPGTGWLCLAPSATRGAQRWWCQERPEPGSCSLSLSLFTHLYFLHRWNHIPNLHNKLDQWFSTSRSWTKNRFLNGAMDKEKQC